MNYGMGGLREVCIEGSGGHGWCGLMGGWVIGGCGVMDG